jgi:hypothetical protein
MSKNVQRLLIALLALALEIPVLYVLITNPEFFAKVFGLR